MIDIINDLHDSLNNMIQMVNPSTISHSPCVLCQVFKEGVKECLTGKPHMRKPPNATLIGLANVSASTPIAQRS